MTHPAISPHSQPPNIELLASQAINSFLRGVRNIIYGPQANNSCSDAEKSKELSQLCLSGPKSFLHHVSGIRLPNDALSHFPTLPAAQQRIVGLPGHKFVFAGVRNKQYGLPGHQFFFGRRKNERNCLRYACAVLRCPKCIPPGGRSQTRMNIS
jgi:hypothetical protein